MKEKVSYIIAGFIVYFVLGLIISYTSYSEMNWKFIFFWMVSMTLADFFILRNLKKRLSKKHDKNA
nr:hypothetical protein [uncultured Flavobacterium sp.]